MLDRLSVSGLALLVGAVAIILLGSGYIWLGGSAVVVDETDGVESAFIIGGNGTEQQLYELWSGYFYGIPDGDGTIEVRCRDGSRKRGGYVSGFWHTKLRVVGETPCARLVER
jgi:hypothetical protein